MSKQRRRDTTLTIRLTKAEKERIERNAKRAARSIIDYLVLLSLETPIHVAEDVTDRTQTHRQQSESNHGEDQCGCVSVIQF